MLPKREEAKRILEQAEKRNPGPWGNHSRYAGLCAEAIAMKCTGLDPEKAYLLGLLHDIGRNFGIKHIGHVYDGYHYMMDLGYDEVARVCLTHSFSVQNINCYIGKFDITENEMQELKQILSDLVYDDYDRLIQLCDCLAGSEGVVDMEARMADVKMRYGMYPVEKWKKNMELKTYFEKIMGQDVYEVVNEFIRNTEGENVEWRQK